MKVRKNNFLNKKRSIEFNILVSCLSIMVGFSLLLSLLSLNSFSEFVQNTSEAQTKEISRQIVHNYDNYISTIIDAYNGIQVKIDNLDVKASAEVTRGYLEDFLLFKTDITDISLFSLDGVLYGSTTTTIYNPGLVIQQAWFERAVNEPSLVFFSNPYIVDGDFRILVSKVVKHNRGTEKALMMMELDSSPIINLAESANLGKEGRILLLDSDYNNIYSSINDKELSKAIRTVKEIIIGSGKAHLNSYDMDVNVDTLTNTKWKIAVFINIDNTKAVQENYIFIIIIIGLFMVVAAVTIIGFTSRRIANPLKVLEKSMKKIEQADFLIIEPVEEGSQKEVASLSNSFNLMMARIKELMDRIIVEQNAQRESELKALQSQINPHFLYNTLDSIVWLIENDKNTDASQMVVALAKLFRISISRGRNIITIKDELEHARSYLIIQRFRYSDSFKYEFDVDEEVLEYTTMKLILQPLIENAIYHGLKNIIDEGFIKIGAHREQDNVVFTVTDNGYGLKKEKIEQLYTNFKNPHLNDGVGLKNVYLRLVLYYGKAADLQIESELDEGTTIKIIIPIKRSEQNVEN
ncbi:MAG TPA: sensor histidine kinase [Bacilli bacterium]|nr:sensor histidine kinase [Bacilli bacterium]